MRTLVAALVAFAAAGSVDLLMALWVVDVARHRRLRASALSMGCAVCLLLGIERVITNGWIVKSAWVFGYGVGTWVAVSLAMRAKRKGFT